MSNDSNVATKFIKMESQASFSCSHVRLVKREAKQVKDRHRSRRETQECLTLWSQRFAQNRTISKTRLALSILMTREIICIMISSQLVVAGIQTKTRHHLNLTGHKSEYRKTL